MGTYRQPTAIATESLDLGRYLFTCAEIAALPDSVDLIPGLLAGDLTGVIGRPFCGKTWLTLHMVAALLLNRPILGREPVKVDGGHRVAIFTTDPGTHKRALKRLAELGVTDEHYDRLQFWYRYDKLGVHGSTPVIHQLQAFEPTLVVIDNLGGSIPADADPNSPGEIGRTLAAIVDLSDHWPTLIVGHTSKPGSGNGSRGGKTALGATKIDGDARRSILLDVGSDGQGSTYRELTITNNDDPPESLAVDLAGPSLALVERRAKSTTKVIQERKRTGQVVVVAELLWDHAESVTSYADAARVVLDSGIPYDGGRNVGTVAKWIKRNVFESKGHNLLVLDQGMLTRGPGWPAD